MKAIIAGKRYDTETAELIARCDNGFSRSDFANEEEALFKTKKGNWFLHGVGGATSKYSISDGKDFRGGEEIVLMTDIQAEIWLEGKGFVEELEEHFSETLQDG